MMVTILRFLLIVNHIVVTYMAMVIFITLLPSLNYWRIDMTEEIYNKATNLRSLIEKDKKALKSWKEAVDATEETITLSNGLGYNGYERTSIFRFISFKELKDMAIERLTKSLEQHKKCMKNYNGGLNYGQKSS